jgi:hypothetical protein
VDSGAGGTGGVALETGGTPNVDAGRTDASLPPTACQVGSYAGKLNGIYKSGSGITQAQIGATISFSVDASGAVSGTYAGPSSSKATLTGSVDCQTGNLEVQVTHGSYVVTFVTVNFSGTLTGVYDLVNGQFTDGEWQLSEPNDSADGGQGTWVQT